MIVHHWCITLGCLKVKEKSLQGNMINFAVFTILLSLAQISEIFHHLLAIKRKLCLSIYKLNNSLANKNVKTLTSREVYQKELS